MGYDMSDSTSFMILSYIATPGSQSGKIGMNLSWGARSIEVNDLSDAQAMQLQELFQKIGSVIQAQRRQQQNLPTFKASATSGVNEQSTVTSIELQMQNKQVKAMSAVIGGKKQMVDQSLLTPDVTKLLQQIATLSINSIQKTEVISTPNKESVSDKKEMQLGAIREAVRDFNLPKSHSKNSLKDQLFATLSMIQLENLSQAQRKADQQHQEQQKIQEEKIKHRKMVKEDVKEEDLKNKEQKALELSKQLGWSPTSNHITALAAEYRQFLTSLT